MKELRICSCGCIHFIDSDVIENAITNEKNVLFICGQCGRATVIGADKYANPYMKDENDSPVMYDMYSYEASKNFAIDCTAFEKQGNDFHKPIYQILYDKGHVVFMETGYRATNYSSCSGFSDTSYPDFLYRLSFESAEQLRTLRDEYDSKRTSVRMNSLIRDLSDEENELLSKSYVKGIDYTGTKWERR